MFVTNDDALYETVLTLSNHGRARGQTKQFWPDKVGFKYKMSNIQAAIGCGQMERVDELIAGKRRIFHAYQEALDGLPGLSLNPEPVGTRNGYWMPTVLFDETTGVTREMLRKAFQQENADARVFFWPLSSLSLFATKPSNRVAHTSCERAINLPSYHDMTAEELFRITEVLTKL
jgi:perosamine synthetase